MKDKIKSWILKQSLTSKTIKDNKKNFDKILN